MWWVSSLIQATISSLNKQHLTDRLANTAWIQPVFATHKFLIMKSFQSGRLTSKKKYIHWIWISQRNPFDGDCPYSFKDLFARVQLVFTLIKSHWVIRKSCTQWVQGSNVTSEGVSPSDNSWVQDGPIFGCKMGPYLKWIGAPSCTQAL